MPRKKGSKNKSTIEKEKLAAKKAPAKKVVAKKAPSKAPSKTAAKKAPVKRRTRTKKATNFLEAEVEGLKVVEKKEIIEESLKNPLDVEDKGTLTFMGDDLINNSILHGTMSLKKGDNLFTVSMDKNSQLTTISYSTEKISKRNDAGFKITIAPAYLQKLLLYMFATPLDKLDAKIKVVRGDIIKNTKFYSILDVMGG